MYQHQSLGIRKRLHMFLKFSIRSGKKKIKRHCCKMLSFNYLGIHLEKADLQKTLAIALHTEN